MSPHTKKLACFAMAATLTLGAIAPLGSAYAADEDYGGDANLGHDADYNSYIDFILEINEALAQRSVPEQVRGVIEEIDRQLPDTRTHRNLQLGINEVIGRGLWKVWGPNEVGNARYFFGDGGPMLSADRSYVSLALDVEENILTPPEGFTKDQYNYYGGQFANFATCGQSGDGSECKSIIYSDNQYNADTMSDVTLWLDSRTEKSFEELIAEAMALDAYENNPEFKEFIDTEMIAVNFGIDAAKKDLTTLGIAYPEDLNEASLLNLRAENSTLRKYRLLAMAYDAAMSEVNYRACWLDGGAFDAEYCQEQRANFYISQPKTRAAGMGAEGDDAATDTGAGTGYGSDVSLTEKGIQLVAAAKEVKEDLLASVEKAEGSANPTETSETKKEVKAPKAGVLGEELSAFAKNSVVAIAVFSAVAGAIYTAKRYLFSPLKRRK